MPLDLTDAPWRVVPHFHDLFKDVQSEDATICVVYNHARNNASLIAAAPELLEVAKRIRWLLAQKRYPGIERDEQAILAEAEAAIKKIEGE